MIEFLHQILTGIHVPFGFLSLVLFWIPAGVKKGSPLHRKAGRYYYLSMWIVLSTAFLLSICNALLGRHLPALYLGYLTIITAYPLWYSYEILRQQKEWSPRYFTIRKVFVTVLFCAGLGMILLGGIKYHFRGIGTMMGFFGLLAMPAGRDLLMSKARAMNKETKLKMHIQGTIISGIAAYTAFFAFGGQQILMEFLGLHPQWMVIPWIAPTLLGITYSRYMKRKYKAA